MGFKPLEHTGELQVRRYLQRELRGNRETGKRDEYTGNGSPKKISPYLTIKKITLFDNFSTKKTLNYQLVPKSTKKYQKKYQKIPKDQQN